MKAPDFDESCETVMENLKKEHAREKQIKRGRGKEKLKKTQSSSYERQAGSISPYGEQVSTSKLMFDMANHSVGDIMWLPMPRLRILELLQGTKYTYLDAIFAEIINRSLEGDMAASKLALSLLVNEPEGE